MKTVGREAETSTLADFFDLLVDGDPHMLVLRGPAGVGKSHLLERGVSIAEYRNVNLIRAAGHPNEGQVAYAGLADLFHDLDLDAFELPEPQRLAIEVLLHRRTSEHSGDPLTVRSAVRTVLAGLSKGRALVVAIDDLQWVDNQTLEALLFALPRLRLANRSVGLLATWRLGEGTSATIDAIFAEAGSRELRVEPLTDSSIATIVALTSPGLSEPDVRRRTALAAGIPLFAVELARHHVADGDKNETLPVSIDASFGRRLRKLSTGAHDVIGLCALSVSPSVALLSACLGKSFVEVALDELVHADLATYNSDAVQLRHPLVATAVVGRQSTAEVRRLRELLAHHAPSQTEAAHHLRALHFAPHNDTAVALVGASQEHSSRAAPIEAAALAEAAVVYTPADHPDRDSRVTRALQLLIEARAADRAVALVELVGALSDPAGAWARWALGMAAFMNGQLDSANAILGEVPTLTSDAEVIERAMVDRAFIAVQLGRFTDALNASESAIVASDGLGNAVRSEALAVNIAVRATTGLPWPASQLDEALQFEDFRRRTQPYLSASGVAATVAIFNDDHVAAERLLMRLVDNGAAAGPVGEVAWTSMFLGYTRSRLGTLRPADGLLTSHEEFTWVDSYADGFARILNGTEPLGPFVELLHAMAGAVSSVAGLTLNILASRMVADAMFEGLISFAPFYWQQFQSEAREPTLFAWGMDLAEAYLAVGNTSDALAVVDSMRELTILLPRRSVAAWIDRFEALRCSRGDDLAVAFAHAEASVAGFTALGWPVELARSLLVRAHLAHRGRQYRIAGVDAARALALFTAAGFTSWAKVATLDVERYARRRSTGTDRTAIQERVAGLVLDGLSTNAIGERLNISVKTVESHLSEIYRREGVSGRSALQAKSRKAT